MCLYLIGWCFMDAGAIAAGLGFNGFDEHGVAKFDRVLSCCVRNLEFSYQVKDFLANWNISAHLWLKYYIYMRL